MDKRPIGIFDSGVGGLTVVKELREMLPNESFIYYGDLGHIPYGEKTHDEVLDYSRRIARFLVSQDVKMIIIACGTATCHSLNDLRRELPVPVFGVVAPGAMAAYQASLSKKIGILATNSTVKSRRYDELLYVIDPICRVISQGCPKFVELAESETADREAIIRQAREYLVPLIMGNVDTIVLGCTHFPLLADEIKELAGPYIRIVNPSYEVVNEVCGVLADKKMMAAGERTETYYVSARPEHLKRMARRVLNEEIEVKEQIL